MEAITSRALLLAGVGQAAKHAGQTTLRLMPMNPAKDKRMALAGNIRAGLGQVRCVAEQLPKANRWLLSWSLWWRKSTARSGPGYRQARSDGRC